MESVWTHPNSGAVLAAMDVVAAEASPEDDKSFNNSDRAKSVRFALLRVPLENDNVAMPPVKSKPTEGRSKPNAGQVLASSFKLLSFFCI